MSTEPRQRRRNPVLWGAPIALVIALGLGSRRYAASLPWFVVADAGDALWATAAFLGLGLLLPRAPTWRVALWAICFSVSIEVSQLYKAPWIDSIRRTTVGGRILGYDFVLSDLACYAVGVGIGMLVERGPARSVPDPPGSSMRGDERGRPAGPIGPR